MFCDFSPVAFYVFGFPVHWYALAYIFGILFAFQTTKFLGKKSSVDLHKNIDAYFEDFMSYVVFGIIIGGRLGHILFYEFSYYMNHCGEILKLWKGGMSFFGGFIGLTAATYFFCKTKNIKFLSFIDLWSVSVPIGLFFGRIANFINGELLGKVSTVSWCVIFRDGIPRHPSQIYEAFLEGVFLFLVMIFSFHKKCFAKKGMLSGIFCCGYGIARFIGEFFREPDSVFSYKLFCMFGINLNQFLSIGIFLLGFALIYRKRLCFCSKLSMKKS